jgi:hypothetical protein
MRRTDNALEVRMIGKPILLGWLTKFDGSKCRDCRDVHAMSSVFEVMKLPLKRLNRFFTWEEMESHNAWRDSIAFYAHSTVDTSNEGHLFDWDCAEVTMEQYEQIFDFPFFEPFDDGPRDLRDAEDVDDAIYHTGGYVSPFSAEDYAAVPHYGASGGIAGAIIPTKIITGSITADKIAANTITATNIIVDGKVAGVLDDKTSDKIKKAIDESMKKTLHDRMRDYFT